MSKRNLSDLADSLFETIEELENPDIYKDQELLNKRILNLTLVLALMFSVSLEGNSLVANAKTKASAAITEIKKLQLEAVKFKFDATGDNPTIPQGFLRDGKE